MAIITISRGSYSKGREVAEKVADMLGYQCISREILLEASEQFNIPEIKLVRSLHDAPSILQRFTYGKERYLAYITAELLERIVTDNIVYHGLAGQFLVRGISHVLKIRILADMEDRLALEMARENISREKAAALLTKDDQERRQWSLSLFGIDSWNPGLYDMVLHIHKLNTTNVAEIIADTARLEQFKATAQSQKNLDNRLLAARVKAALVQVFPMVQTYADDGVVTVEARFNLTEEPGLADKMQRIALQVPGVKQVRMRTRPVSAYAGGNSCAEG